MKRQFLIACTFIFAITTGVLQANSNPTMSRVYGNQFTPQTPDTQALGPIGGLDGTFANGGYQDLNAQLTPPSSAVAIQALPDGTFLTVLQGSSTLVAKYNAEGTIIQTYGSTGVAALGLTTVQASMLDVQGRLLVAGNTSGTPYIQRVTPDGSNVSSFMGGTWSSVAGLAQQTTGKIIAVGLNGTYGQIARYTDGTATVAGSLDTSSAGGNSPFNGGTGVIVFDGTNGITSTTGLYNVVVDATNNIYVAYCDSGNSGNLYVAKFSVDGAFVSTTHLPYFDGGATPSQVRMAMDMNGNLVVAAQVGTSILVSAQILTTGSFTNTTVSGTYTLNLGALVTTSNGEILLIGNDTDSSSNYFQRITCLLSTGGLNPAFNNASTPGYKEFTATATPSVAASLYAAAIAPDGQIYAVGCESSGTLQPYVYRLNNYSYVSQVAQFPTVTLEQGILDQSFGNPATQQFPGITSPFNGLYGSSMMQRATAAIEITLPITGSPIFPLGDILVGMNGFTNSSNLQQMMFACLTPEGSVDTSVNSGGYLTLNNFSGTNEYLNMMLESAGGVIWVAGYTSGSTTPSVPGVTSTAAILRSYSSSTSGTAAIHYSEAATGYQGVGVSAQGATRSLLCVAESTTVGHISGVNSSGLLDTTFGPYVSGSSGPQTGKILTTSYSGMHMGPSYGLAVANNEVIYAAYVNSSVANQVDVAAFEPEGTKLVPGFGSSGIKSNLFTVADYTVLPQNVRIGFIEIPGATPVYNIIVAATGSGTGAGGTTSGRQYLLVASLDQLTGTSNYVVAIDTHTLSTSALNITRVTGVNDGTFVVTFSDGTNENMYLARFTQAGALDTTFNSQGVMQGILPIQIGDASATYNTRIAKSALIQSYYSGSGTNYTGNIAVVGYESITANDVTPMAMRVYGAPGTTEVIDYPISVINPGTFDEAFDLTQSPTSLAQGFGKVIFTYPSTNVANTGKMLVGIDTGSNTIIARVFSGTMALDTSTAGGNIPFNGSTGYVTLTGYSGVTHVSIDARNNVLVGGSSGGTTGWAATINNAGTTTTQFTMPTTPYTIAAVNNIGQQESGRYIIAGKETTTNKGIVIAFQDELVSPATAFAIDPTFNPLSVGSATAGSFYAASTDGLYAMAINTTYNLSPLCNIDTIVVAYSVSNVVNIAEITADGSGFAIAAFAATGVACDSSAAVQLNIDGSNNIVVGASRNSSTPQIQVKRYDSAGGTSTAFTGVGVSSGVQTLLFAGSSSVTLTGLMETISQQTVLTGYNTPSGSPIANGDLFAARLVADGSLDFTWNPFASNADYPGLLTYGADGAINSSASAIALNGNVYSIGSTSGTVGSSDAIVAVVYGDPYVTQVPQNPLESAAGTLDSTIPGNISGALALSGLITGVPQKIYMYSPTVSNGQMLIASVDSSANVYVTLLNADLSLGTFGTFGTPGVAVFNPNLGLTPTSVTITDMYVATNNSGVIYIAGYTTTGTTNTAFAERISADGSNLTPATPVSALVATSTPSASGIRQSSNGRVLISGYNGTLGCVVAYNSAMNAIDTSFGNGNGTGYYTNTPHPIAAMTTDDLDRIYIAYYDPMAFEIKINRLLENGTGLDTSFNSGGTVILSGSGLSATQIKLAIDLTNNQLIVAAQDGTGSGYIQLARFNFDGSSAGTLLNTITVGSALNLSDLFIDNSTLYSASPNIYVVGYTNSGNSVVARVKSPTTTSLALDTNYATTGIANILAGAMTVVTAAALDPDRRVYLVGSHGSTTGYMGRFFGDYYWTQASTAIIQGAVGSVDTTLSPNSGDTDTGTAGINLVTGFTGWGIAGYTAYAIIENSNGNGTSFIAFGDGNHLVVGKLNADMSSATFGTGGLTTISLPMVTVNNMSIDNAGNIVVCGVNAGGAGIGYVISANGTSLLATTDATTDTVTAANTILQQKSGRYIIASAIAGSGSIVAYKNLTAVGQVSAGILPVDPTFGQLANQGYYTITSPTPASVIIDDICIDSNDYIYMVYRVSNVVTIAKLTPQGELVTTANAPSKYVWSTNPITTSITATAPARIAINSGAYILVGAATAGGGTPDIEVVLYSSTTGGSPVHAVVPVYATANNPVLTRLVGSGTDFYGSFYNSATTAAGYVFAVTSAGILDTGFTSNPLLLTGQTPSLTNGINGLSVQYDGKIVAVGYNGTDAILMRAYGYPYAAQYVQQDQSPAGLLDPTLWPDFGALELDTYTPISTTITTLSGSQVSRIYEYITTDANNGKALLLFNGTSSNVNTVLARVNTDLTLDTATFGSGTGFVTITGEIHANALFVDSSGNIFVAGGGTLASPATSWVRAYTNAGVALLGWTTPTQNLAGGAFQVGKQSVDRLILAGLGASHGTLYGYTTAGVLDNTFGVAGVVDMGSTNAITDFAVDSLDRIITVSNNAGSVVLSRVAASGLGTPLVSGGTQITTAVSGSAIKVVLDASNRIIVAAATATGFQLGSYNNDSTLGSNMFFATITAGTSSPAWVLGNIYATEDGKITLIGYDSASGSSTAGMVMVARLISGSSGLTLDTVHFNAAGTSPSGPGYLVTLIHSLPFLALDAIIGADDRIMIAGSQTPVSTAEPFLARVFGDVYTSVVPQSQTQGVAGTINPTFGTGGVYDDSTLNSLLSGAQGKAIFPLSDGGYYQAFDLANSLTNSILIKTLADGTLDSSYNNSVGGHIAGIAGSATIPNYAPLGVNSILQGVVSGADSASYVLLVGTNGSGGWLQRYASDGTFDPHFSTVNVSPTAGGTTSANVAVEQTLARYVVAGFDGAHAALFAYQSLAPNGIPGVVDITFNNTGAYPGRFILSSNTNAIPTLIADQYDRLIFAVLNSGTNAVDLYRLTPTGELDVTFGASNGVVAGAIAGASSASQIRIALDSAGHIVVAAQTTTSGTTNITVAAYNNGVLTGLGTNGGLWTNAFAIPNLLAPTTNTDTSLTALITSADNNILVLGNQLGTTTVGGLQSPAWIARLANTGSLGTYALDGTFNPAGNVHGIFEYSSSVGTTSPYNVYEALAVNADGTLGMLGYEVTSGPAYVPTLVSIYNDPYTAQESQSPDAKPVGSIDPTLGVGAMSTALTAVAKGVVFYGASGTSASGQVAEAVALYDDNNIVVAIDGSSTASAGASQIMINMLDNDGLLNPNFGSSGTATVSLPYQNQYVRDMVVFTSGDVTKAILAGYVLNTNLLAVNQYSSLLLQYILNPDGTPGDSKLDTTFGGLNGTQAGVALGDGQQLFTVGQQSTGRIIASGLSKDSSPLGVLLGYTSTGRLDLSFGENGYQSVGTGTTGLYTHAIDSKNRIVIAYNNGSGTLVVARMLADGSGLDTTFNSPHGFVTTDITALISNSNIKVAVDSSNNVYVAAVINDGTGSTGNAIAIRIYAAYDGSELATNTLYAADLGASTASDYVLGRLIVDQGGPNGIIVASDASYKNTVVARVTHLLALDPTFNAVNTYTNPYGTPGYITYQVNGGSASQTATDAMIHPDGRIIIVGSEL